LILEGKTAPHFSLQGSDGQEHSPRDYRGSKLILYFYPRDHSPGWTKQAVSFRDSYSALEELKVKVLGISKDSLKSHHSFIDKNNLPFVLLSDPDKKAHKLYGVLNEKGGTIRSTCDSQFGCNSPSKNYKSN